MEQTRRAMSEPKTEAANGFERTLGLFDLVMMGAGMMIGAGAVLGMGDAVRLAGLN